VAHVVSSLSVGGMERFVLRLAAEQRAAGHRPTIFALRGGPLLPEARAAGLDVVVGAGGFARRVASMLAAMALARPQIIHAHNPTSLHYAVAAKLLTGARVLMTDHAQGHGLPRMPTGIERRTVDAIVAVSRHTATLPIAPEFAERTVVIHNGVQVPEAPAGEIRERARAGLGVAHRFVGVMPASLKPIKGHRVLLQSVAALTRQGIPLTMLLAGEGPEQAELQQLARRLQLTDEDVRFLGFRADVAELLHAADFMVLPSLSEGLPLSVLEAMIHGAPVVASRVGGIPEVVTDGVSGMLVPPGDDRALAAAIATLHASPELRHRLARAARRTAETDFSFDLMCRRYGALYARLLESR
jgi:glycosyltransferase involved in cell wall biosynthesis